MTSNDIVRRAIRLALANAAAASIALPALANADEAPTGPQQTPAAASDENANTPALQEVVVTGSRIAQPGLESISPVTTVSQKDIAAQGFSSVEDVLNNMPQVMADQGSAVSNGATGTATVNLRNLGPQRTLVLVNGRRLMPGDPNNTPVNAGPADLNNIPIALVDRVDLLTGGASAVYGADAVSGVVNFVMNDHFQGFRVDVNGSAYQHSQHSSYGNLAPAHNYGSAPSNTIDGGARDVTFILGNNFADGKGNATAYLEYRSQAPLLEDTRDFSRCTLAGGYTKPACSGSSTAATGRFYATNGNFFPSTYTASTANGGTLVPWSSADAFNYGALNYYQRPDTRWNAGGFAHYDFDDKHQVYTEFMFMDDRTIAQIAPSGAFIGSGTGISAAGNPDGDWSINCNNPLLSAQEQAIICPGGATGNAQVLFGRRNVEGGDRRDDLRHTSFRLVVGTKGEINSVLSYDVYAQEGQTLLSENYNNDVSRSRLANALQAVTENGKVICAANANGANQAPGCVPYNIWGTGAVDPASVAYFSVPGLREGSTEERVYHADLTADFGQVGVKLPTANEGLFVNFGAEYREEFEQIIPDQEYITNDLAGQGNPTLPLSAGFGVKEGFFEGRLPILQDAPFAKELSVEAGYRYSAYDLGFNTNTYKFGVDWAPTSDFRVRAGYNRAVRAPNLTELFAQRFVGNDGSADPCASSSGTTPAVADKAHCANSGMTAAQYGTVGTPGNPAGQYNGRLGGNPNLKPETADTYTFGFVVTPTLLPNLTATIDYFDIKIKNDITTYGANLILNQCVNNNVQQFCSMVHRDPGTGSLWFTPFGYVDDPLANLGYQWTRGVDLGVRYRQEMGAFGRMDFNLQGTYTASFITEPYAGSGTYDCAGFFGPTCGNPQPKWRHVLRDTWQTPIKSLDLTVSWRHFGGVTEEALNPSPLLNGTPPNGITGISSRDYFDLSASYMVFPGVTVRVGVNNVTDKDPPVLPTTGLSSAFFNGNTYPQVYDYLGRYLFANLTADF